MEIRFESSGSPAPGASFTWQLASPESQGLASSRLQALQEALARRRPHDALTGWKGDFWKRRPDPFSLALREAPVLFEPGSRHAYSNPGMAALAYAVTASLRGTLHPDLRSVLEARFMGPMGVAPQEW